MIRARALTALVAVMSLACLVHCQDDDHSPPACERIDLSLAGLEPDTAYGMVDLHAHPAIERAFGGRLVWGHAMDDAPVNANELPEIDACPVETHDKNAASPIDRAVGTIVYPQVASVGHFAHAPVGTGNPGDAWPNARDIIHQQMNVASIRRAYEGGLRLMFASATDSQVLAHLLKGPNFDGGFVPDPHSDYVSAREQLALIQDMVHANSRWMGIAKTPQDARNLIHDGKLALVMSLEMDGLLKGDLDTLIHDFHVAHVLPIHLLDNDVGGTAGGGDLFNAASAEVSAIYRRDERPLQFMDVRPTTTFKHTLGWPSQIVTGPDPSAPLFASIDAVPFSRYSDQCYEPIGPCAGSAPTFASFLQLGQANARGLCSQIEDCPAAPGKSRIQSLMEQGILVDVSHMSDLSARDALGTAAPDSWPGKSAGVDYPFIASHGDFARLCADGSTACESTSLGPQSERTMLAELGRQVVQRGGVIGFGTPIDTYRSRAVLDARGAPLLTLPTTGATACVERNGAVGSACTAAPVVDESSRPLTTLLVRTHGGPSGPGPNVHPYVRVELEPPCTENAQRRVVMAPMQCGTGDCEARLSLGSVDAVASLGAGDTDCTPPQGHCDGACTPYGVPHIASVKLEMLYLACDLDCQKNAGAEGKDLRCKTRWDDAAAPHWTFSDADVLVESGAAPPTPLVHVGPFAPDAQLDKDRGELLLYQRDACPSSATKAAWNASPGLFRVTVKAGSTALEGAGPSQVGGNVCVALRTSDHGTCASSAPVPTSTAGECPPGYSPMNHRGAWANGGTLYTFVRTGAKEADVCGVDFVMLDAPGPTFTIDDVTVDAIEDPIEYWVRRYADLAHNLAGDHKGVIGLGTDFNGLNGLIDISATGLPSDATTPSACYVDGNGPIPGTPQLPQRLGPMRLRHHDGTIGDEIRIEERGLATYGLLADFLAVVEKVPSCGPEVKSSLLLSAEATIRAWEKIVDPTAKARMPLPIGKFQCGGANGN